jgi:hypothetical protein
MNALNVKPNDRFLKDYYAALGQYSQFHLDHEGPSAARSGVGPARN